MTKPRHVTIVGQIRFSMTIYCHKCGTQALSRHSVFLDPISITDLKAVLIDRMPDIPVGWAMNGRDKLICQSCM